MAPTIEIEETTLARIRTRAQGISEWYQHETRAEGAKEIYDLLVKRGERLYRCRRSLSSREGIRSAMANRRVYTRSLDTAA